MRISPSCCSAARGPRRRRSGWPPGSTASPRRGELRCLQRDAEAVRRLAALLGAVRRRLVERGEQLVGTFPVAGVARPRHRKYSPASASFCGMWASRRALVLALEQAVDQHLRRGVAHSNGAAVGVDRLVGRPVFSSALPSALYAIARASREATSLWLSDRASGSTRGQSPPTACSSCSYSWPRPRSRGSRWDRRSSVQYEHGALPVQAQGLRRTDSQRG